MASENAQTGAPRGVELVGWKRHSRARRAQRSIRMAGAARQGFSIALKTLAAASEAAIASPLLTLKVERVLG